MRLLGRSFRPGDSPRPYYLAVVGTCLLGAQLILIATLRGGFPKPLGPLGGGTFVAASGALLYAVGRRDLANRRTLTALLHQHEEALASLSALTDASMAILPLDRLLDELLVRLQEVLGVATAAILLFHEPDTDLEVEAWRGDGAADVLGTKAAADEGVLGQIVQSPGPVVMAHAGAQDQPALLRGLVSVAGCRIIVQGRPIGVCLVGSTARMEFADRDIQLLQLVADRAGVGIERKLLESGMREAQRMEAIGQVAGGVAHDFNNLLTVITGYTDLLYQRLDLDDDTNREMLGGISDSAARASLLTGQLLTIGRRQKPKPEVIEPAAALKALAEVLDRILGIDIALRWSLGPDTGNINVDPARFEQLILNLAINARDAMPDGGRLEIACGPGPGTPEEVEALELAPGRYVRITVADTGTGMDEETRRRCYEAFFTTKERSRGTGLGLTAVRGVVTDSGGSIVVNSELGKGTRFDLYLPRTDESVTVAVAHVPPAAARGAETILVVEDQPDVRRLICRVLDRGGYQVLSAEDGAGALQLSEHWDGRIDLVVTDVVMPNMRGPEVVEHLLKARPSMAVLYVSGDTDGTTVADRSIAQAAGLLAKPFKPSELSTRVRDVLDEHHRQARNGSPRPEPS